MFTTANQGDIATITDISQLVDRGYVASSPGLAVDRIAERYGEVPNRLGTNCHGLTLIRDEIEAITQYGDLERTANALVLVAPHTHWRPAPIIYTYSTVDHRYCVGPQIGRAPFVATSFVFCKNGPIPYEWADASCSLDPGEVEEAHQIVRNLNDAVCSADGFVEPCLIAISINHRFKKIFDFPLTSTHESPDEHEMHDPEALAYITPSTTSEDLERIIDDQVGWTAHHPPKLEQTDLEKFKVIEQLLAEIGPDGLVQLGDL